MSKNIIYYEDRNGNPQKVIKVGNNAWMSTGSGSLVFRTAKECFRYLDVPSPEQDVKTTFEQQQFERNKKEVLRILSETVGINFTEFNISDFGDRVYFQIGYNKNYFQYIHKGKNAGNITEINYSGDYTLLSRIIEVIENTIKNYKVVFDGLMVLYKNAVESQQKNGGIFI